MLVTRYHRRSYQQGAQSSWRGETKNGREWRLTLSPVSRFTVPASTETWNDRCLPWIGANVLWLPRASMERSARETDGTDTLESSINKLPISTGSANRSSLVEESTSVMIRLSDEVGEGPTQERGSGLSISRRGKQTRMRSRTPVLHSISIEDSNERQCDSRDASGSHQRSLNGRSFPDPPSHQLSLKYWSELASHLRMHHESRVDAGVTHPYHIRWCRCVPLWCS